MENSNNLPEENPAPTLAEVVRKFSTEELIEFLREQEDLELTDAHFEILRNEEITGRTFLKTTKNEFRSLGLTFGPASALVEFVKEIKKKKLRAYSSYRSLKEVLQRHDINGDSITNVPQFRPGILYNAVVIFFSKLSHFSLFCIEIHILEDDDEELLQCIKEIKRRLANMGTVADSNEAMRSSYIEVILHTALHIIRKLIPHDLSLCPQFEVVGEDSTGRVDWAIKELEDLLAITEGKQNLVAIGIAQNLIQLESSYQTNKKKRKADDAFYDYLYGIVTTG